MNESMSLAIPTLLHPELPSGAHPDARPPSPVRINPAVSATASPLHTAGVPPAWAPPPWPTPPTTPDKPPPNAPLLALPP